MGRRGPKPQSETVKSQKAAVRSKRDRKPSAAAAAAVAMDGVAPPAWLKKEGLKIWNALAPKLHVAKLLSAPDAFAFARYCKHYARWLDLQKRLDTDGDIYEIETASGKVRRADPAFTMCDRLDRMMLAMEDRFGINPAERQRIMAARASTGSVGDLFGPTKNDERRPDDPAAPPAAPAVAVNDPIGLLN